MIGPFEVDLRARVVRRGVESVDLAPLEFDLLACLIRHRGEAVSRARLLEEVWGFPEPDRIRTRTIDTHVASLRSKLEADPAAPSLILTVRKVGYRLVRAFELEGGDLK